MKKSTKVIILAGTTLFTALLSNLPYPWQWISLGIAILIVIIVMFFIPSPKKLKERRDRKQAEIEERTKKIDDWVKFRKEKETNGVLQHYTNKDLIKVINENTQEELRETGSGFL